MGISNITLVKIASVGGIMTVAMGMATRFKINNNIRDRDYYKEAFKIVRSHPGAVKLLGEPIKDCTIDVGDVDRNYTKGSSAHYEVPVKGMKDRGTVYLWANSKGSSDQWTISRIELQVNSEPNRRLLIKHEETQN